MKKNIIFYSVIILLIIAKLYLISSLPISAEYTTILDDALFVKQANSIVEGRWLGDYDNTTLIKGVFMPLFIVVLYIFKIPYIIGQELFYSIACVLFITIIKDKVKSKPILLIIFTILLLNPITYSTELCRIYRDGVYASLILYLVSFIYAIFLKREEPAKKLVKYFIGLGFSFSAIYLCREETIWIMPFVIIATIITIGFIIKQKKKLLLYLIPTGILTISILIVCLLNYKYYGVFELNQYWNTSFKSAYGALTRVTPEQRKERVPVTRETLHRVYEISPKFNELKDYLESEEGYEWASYGDGTNIYEIEGGWLHWAIMFAAQSKGYYESASKANQYYIDLANEINEAVDTGKIEGLDRKRVSNSIITTKEDIPKIVKKIKNTIRFEYKMLGMKIKINRYPYKDEEYAEYEKMFDKMIIGQEFTQDTFASEASQFKINVLQKIFDIYKSVNEYIFYLSIVLYIILTILFIIRPKKTYQEFLILSSLLVIYLSRVVTIGYTSQQMFTEAINTSYLACIYGIQYLFGMLAIIFVFEKIKELRGEIREKNI